MATPPRALEGRSERGAQSSAPEWPDVYSFARCTCYAGVKPCTPGEIMYSGEKLARGGGTGVGRGAWGVVREARRRGAWAGSAQCGIAEHGVWSLELASTRKAECADRLGGSRGGRGR